MNEAKSLIKNILRPYYRALCGYKTTLYRKNQVKRLSKIVKKDDSKARIFYLGITAHSNLGDMAQYYCIHSWLHNNYPDTKIYEFESNVVVNLRFGFVEKLKSLIKKDDMIVFQSGYTTQDLGGDHDLMHRLIIDNIPGAKILMMPQTIFFKKEENKQRTAQSYNKAKDMLFLARDNVSYRMALEMFSDIHVKPFPDIVTSLIGHFNFRHQRKGVLICRRNDGEKFYTENQIIQLKNTIENEGEFVTISDTKSLFCYKKIRKNPKIFIEGIIESYSKYKVIITDRYHGTIFSLAANTPVVVLKTTDHKVATGIDWFKGLYDDYVSLAESIEDAFNRTKIILSKKYEYHLDPFLDNEYYGKLKSMMDEIIK